MVLYLYFIYLKMAKKGSNLNPRPGGWSNQSEFHERKASATLRCQRKRKRKRKRNEARATKQEQGDDGLLRLQRSFHV